MKVTVADWTSFGPRSTDHIESRERGIPHKSRGRKGFHGFGQGREDDKKHEVPYTRLLTVQGNHWICNVDGVWQGAR
jgi:hypothetical protein